MATTKDYYEILGVKKDATDAEIKRAYKKMILKYHPDRNPDNKEMAREKSKEINEAYDVLKDPQKKAAYDQYGHAAFQNGMGAGAGAGGFDFSDFGGFGRGGGFSSGGFDDVFDMFFGNRRQSSSGSARPGPERGSDLRYDLEITFEEAAFGKEAELEVPRHENCPDCGGTGAKKGSKPEECPDCKGRGQIETAQTTPFGRIVSRRTCNRCHGTGEIIKNPCNTCHGSGKQKIKRRIKVSIPKGVGDGSRVRIAGGGEAGSHGGENGDLYVYLRVAPHKLFTRRGNDVIIEMPISFVQAALGDTVKVPTIDGQVEMTIPEGIQNGKVLRIKEKGIPYLRGAGRGDEHVIIKVVTPQKLTEKQKSLLREFQNVTDENATPEQKSFMDKVKDMFK